MTEFCFVILHYLTCEDTQQCLNSILDIFDVSYNISVIIVENGPTNKKMELLKRKYSSNKDIYFLQTNENLGYAQGINLGYDFAKTKVNASFIIAMNNDMILTDCRFLSEIKYAYEHEKFAVLGPDIISMQDGGHQNPIKPITTKAEARKLFARYFLLNILNTWGIYNFIKPEKNLNKSSPNIDIGDLQRIAKKSRKKRLNCLESALHGACVIVSDIYIKKNEYLFHPGTFLYLEEDILAYRCKLNQFKMIYDPNIFILHKEDSATNVLSVTSKRKRALIFKNIMKSIKVFVKLVR